jgi:glycosyltransferase involved in cell wall biosynthesis
MEVHIATAWGPKSQEVINLGFKFHTIPFTRSGMRPWEELLTLWALWKLYTRLKPDLVHHVTIKPVLYGGIIARLAGIEAVVQALSGLGFVFTSHSRRASWLRFPVKLMYRVAMRHPNVGVIFQNPDDRELFLKYGFVDKDSTVLIRGSGVDMNEYQAGPIPDREVPHVILASRMLWDKGVGRFSHAARILKERGIKVRMILVGEPDPGNPSSVQEGELRAWVRERHIEWWGYRDDMPSVLAQADVVCLPACCREGLPRVLIEAAACGRPIITTDVPGCREVVRAGQNGLLLPPGDASALADAIASLVEDRPLRQRFGVKSREIAEREFALDLVVEQHLDLYWKLLRGVKPGGGDP